MKTTYKHPFSHRILRVMATVAILAAAGTAQAVEYFQRLAMEGVELVGAITWGKVDEFTVMEPGYYQYSYDNKFAPNKTQPIIKTKALGGCVYHDGKVYSNEFYSQSQYIKPIWRIYDAKTWKLLSEHELKDNCECTTTSLAYDQTTGYIYGFNETYTETYVVRIDPETGEMTRLGNFLDRNYKFFAMACSPTGELYCTYLNKNTDAVYLGKIRKSNGQVAMIRGISATNLLPGDSFINSSYEQSMFYNNATGKLYWMFQSSSALLYKEFTAIFEVNPVTADAVMVAYIEDGLQGPGAFFMEPDMKAPAIISDFTWTPDAEGVESGTVSFKIPAEAYGGSQLTDAMQLTVTAADTVLARAEVTPGQTYTMHLDALPNGWNTFRIHVANAAGDGPTVSRQFFAGYDRPKAPSNVKLTQDGLHTVLTWDAPSEGVSGNVIDKSNLTYTVVRYPGEVTVADGLTDCRFEEDHPAEMARYVYKVSSKVGNLEGRSAMSNNLVVGTPLSVPFGGEFVTAQDLYNYYTILDSNGDNYTWGFDGNTLRAVYSYNMASGADDWLIAPAINYQKGKVYELSFCAFSSSSSYPESLQVTFGHDKTAEAQDSLMLDLPTVPSEDDATAPQEYRLRFSVPSDGVYYYGFHATSAAFREYLYVGDIHVKEVDPAAIDRTMADSRMEIRQEEGLLSVKLDADAAVRVTDLSGRLVGQAYGRDVRLPLSRGVYMVTAGGKTVKTVVR